MDKTNLASSLNQVHDFDEIAFCKAKLMSLSVTDTLFVRYTVYGL